MATTNSQGKPSVELGGLPPVPGCHRGELAGLSAEEREAKVQARSAALVDEDDDFFENPVSMLYNASQPGAPKFALKDILSPMKKDDLLDLAFELQLQGAGGMKKAELVDLVSAGLCDLGNLMEIAETIPALAIDRMKETVEAGGRLYVPEARIKEIEDATPPYEPLMFLYRTRNTFVYVVPDELVDLMVGFDWESLRSKGELRLEIGRLATAAVDLRGIVPVFEFLQEARAVHPEIASDDQLVRNLMETATVYPLFIMLITDDDSFLLNIDLCEGYLQDHDDVRRYGGGVIEGPYDDFLDALLISQGDKPPRPVEPAILDEPLPILWRQTLPDAVALRAWLDENVPDGADDYNFADNMMMQFCDEVKWGDVGAGALTRYLVILSEAGLEVDDAHMQPFLNLLMAFVNNQPIWPNNGWSPQELAMQSDPDTASKLAGLQSMQ